MEIKLSDRSKICGIYKILCISNNKFYVGSSLNVIKRLKMHLWNLKRNDHHSNYLQKCYNKYSINNFKFFLIETCNKDVLINREQHYFDTLNPELNLSKFADRPTPPRINPFLKEKIKLKDFISGKIEEKHLYEFSNYGIKISPLSKLKNNKIIFCRDKNNHVWEIAPKDNEKTFLEKKYPDLTIQEKIGLFKHRKIKDRLSFKIKLKRLKDGEEKTLYNFEWAINYNIHRSMINNIKKGVAKTVLDGFNDRWKVLAVNE
jgi:group I intron endonuclease